ncbi:putative sulfate exporter family transporter [Shewanella sp. D64]|uniref:YeiH family protein n=1 Tax=unclassified Shewanella TaxID=196818 RepID=UPI0022BA67A2|nr:MULTISPECIES: putative sulfate exporter family transporter [unclassified Shewanella]MEC4727567.1 putative sulfate exporter family transporter [Shewanella sp. D64]MEC4739818.1 putative sulfate exporter family transporter [Shewanella sp. E94]WBJ98054.1 putative sulfate exporter family transporter [Shewanella sp. MTB7]
MNSLSNQRQRNHILLFVAIGTLCLLPQVSSPIALVLGFTLASLGLVPTNIDLGSLTKKLLSYSIIGLGFGIQLQTAITVSLDNLPLILGSIIFTLVLGFLLTKALKFDTKTGHLISVGTAICGGSAIAAVSPAINAKSDQIAIALATIFILNSIALFLFPALGHLLSMSQYDFGVWSAIAIHDTSSVVGAASAYGEEALVTATTIKLARALWIIPIALISAILFGGDKKRITIPYFIGFYCLAIAIAYFLPQGQPAYEVIFGLSKRALVLCLFLIGAGITVKKMRAAGIKPLALGVMLWLAIGISSLLYILYL